MELTTIAGLAAGPFLMVFLGWLFTLLARIFYGDWDQAMIPNGAKVVVAPVIGFSLGVLAMYADIVLQNLVINIVSWIKYGYAGFLLGFIAMGMNEARTGGKHTPQVFRTEPALLPGIPREQRGIPLKPVLAILAALFLLLAPLGSAQAMVWKTANQITVAWDPVTTLEDGTPLPAGTTVQYQLYIRVDPNGTPIPAGNPITSAQATVTFTNEGAYDIGVKVQRLVNGELVTESPIGWSNDPAIVQGGITFGDTYYKAPGGLQNLRQP